MRAGAATVNITPALGCSIAGSMRNHIARDVHDELQAKALVLDDGVTRIACVVCDSCAIATEVIHRAKSLITHHTGIAAASVLVAATHTHSAPAAARLFQSTPDADYQRWLATRIADCVRLALNRLQPARAGWAVGTEQRLVFNRRYFMEPGAIPPDPFGRTRDQVLTNPGVANPRILRPAGPTDPEVGLFAVETSSGKPLAALATYALHYVGGVPAGVISADYFGVWADQMRQRLKAGPEFVAILANGCSGDVNNIDVRSPARTYAPFEKMQEVAAVLAAECERLWGRIAFHEQLMLSTALDTVELGTRLPSLEEVAEARKTVPPDAENVSDRRLIYAKETLDLADYPRTVSAPVQALRIGELGIATFAGEAFVELGLEVKRKSPFRPTFLIELANGYFGYIPTAQAHQQGGYETWRAKSSYLEVDAADKLVAAALRSLARLRA